MKRIFLIFIILLSSLCADTFDRAYTCVAYQKNDGSKFEKLNIKESIIKGGYFSLSLKINFLRAIVSRGKNTAKNITYKDIRFAYRDSVNGYDLYVYDYNKDYILIEKANIQEPRFSVKLVNGDRIYHICKIDKEK